MHIQLLERVRLIQLITHNYINGIAGGLSRSKHRGSGFEFDQIREYQPGDDIRFIDWHGSARSNKLLVKQYHEEKSRSIMLCVDGSESGCYTSGTVRKYDVFVSLAIVLALAAQVSNDAVGLIVFTDKIELYIPAVKGLDHVKLIINKLSVYEPNGKTDIARASKFIIDLGKRDLFTFFISDFIQPSFDACAYLAFFQYLRAKGDLVSLIYADQYESIFPTVGYLDLQDSETHQNSTFYFERRAKNVISDVLASRSQSVIENFVRSGIDYLSFDDTLIHDYAFIPKLVSFFAQRGMHH
ncbi:MAG TPA: DUF58 domain-containing protein [Candidatus Babeliales bacterium]|nr:DUF58 domain-containing protein [Candidatus Babeliales bacterium]